MSIIKAAVQDFCLPLLAVGVITKTQSPRAFIIDSALAYSITTVVAVKLWINSFERHTNPAKCLISPSEFDPFGPVTFGKCRRAARLNFIATHALPCVSMCSMHSSGRRRNVKPDTRIKKLCIV